MTTSYSRTQEIVGPAIELLKEEANSLFMELEELKFEEIEQGMMASLCKVGRAMVEAALEQVEATSCERQERKRPQSWKDAKYQSSSNYFKRHRHRMDYARFQKQRLPIGSGVIEGTCKSLASDRLKRAGMRWDIPGGQAILTLRAAVHSERFDKMWTLLAECYRSTR